MRETSLENLRSEKPLGREYVRLIVVNARFEPARRSAKYVRLIGSGPALGNFSGATGAASMSGTSVIPAWEAVSRPPPKYAQDIVTRGGPAGVAGVPKYVRLIGTG
jgi:hypothetical protein